MKVRRCFSFSDRNTTVELVDGSGCPDSSILSPFSYDRLSGTAEAKLYSMFKFPESNRVHFQCDIVICKGKRWIHSYKNYIFWILQGNVKWMTVHSLLRSSQLPRLELCSPKQTPESKIRKMTELWWPPTLCLCCNLEQFQWRNQDHVRIVVGVLSGFSISASPSASSLWSCWSSTCSSARPCPAPAPRAKRRTSPTWRTLIRMQGLGKDPNMAQGKCLLSVYCIVLTLVLQVQCQ